MKKLILVAIFAILLLGLCSCGTVDPCADGHTPGSPYTSVSATCGSKGQTTVICTVCSAQLSTEVLPKLDHASVRTSTQAPLCDADGEAITSCTDCGEVLSLELLPMTGHTPGEQWEVTVAQSCTVDGEQVKICTVCDKVAQSEVIPAGHTPVVLEAVAATCGAEGLTEGSKCSACEEILVAQQAIEKPAHTFVTVDATAPTCSEYGYTDGVRCSVCLLWDVAPTQIEKLAHTEVSDEAKAPTCTENGLTEGKHCSVCRTVTVAQQTVWMLGHDYHVYNNSCSRCGEKQFSEIASRLDLENYECDYDAVIDLDRCVTVSDTSEQWMLSVKDTTNYIRLVGTSGQVYNVRIEVESRETALTVDLVNVSLKSISNDPVIESSSAASLTLGFYGEACAITGKNGAAGKDASLTNFAYNGGNGGNGYDAISVTGDLVIKNGADAVTIKGGNGGKGGDGIDAAPSPQDGGDGGKGGNGAYAIQASSITIQGTDGHSSQSVTLVGGDGGKGGSAGEGFLWGDDGKTGAAGQTQSASTVSPIYQ